MRLPGAGLHGTPSARGSAQVGCRDPVASAAPGRAARAPNPRRSCEEPRWGVARPSRVAVAERVCPAVTARPGRRRAGARHRALVASTRARAVDDSCDRASTGSAPSGSKSPGRQFPRRAAPRIRGGGSPTAIQHEVAPTDPPRGLPSIGRALSGTRRCGRARRRSALLRRPSRENGQAVRRGRIDRPADSPARPDGRCRDDRGTGPAGQFAWTLSLSAARRT